METNDENNASNPASEIELESNETLSSDPIDLIEDVDELRAEAKKFRSISQRKPKAPVVEKPVEPVKPAPTDTSDFLKKSDVARLALQEAKDLASDEVKEHWDELISIPLSGYDNLNAKSIAANMAKRLVIYRLDNPKVEKKETGAEDLSKTNAVGTGGGSGGDKSIPKKDPPNFNLPKKPEEWYTSPK